MQERPIAERIFLDADLERHQDLIDYADYLCRDHQDHAPRIDSGEWTIRAQESIDDWLDHFNQTADPPLRRVVIEWNDSARYWRGTLEPFTGPFPWEVTDG